MDTELLRTFLEVHRMRSFTRAAENLNLTPSAVSARIRQLEAAVRRTLLKRSSQQVALTPAGERLVRHALGIVAAWDRAEKHVALDDRLPVTVAGITSLWDIFLESWLLRMRARLPEAVPWVEISGAARIAEKLEHGQLHLGFLYSPLQIADLLVREVASLELVMVSTLPDQDAESVLAQDYVLLDWGTVVSGQHDRHFPHRPPASVRSNSVRMALAMLRTLGGGAYLPGVMIESDLAAGTLHRVRDAPVFPMPVYAVYMAQGEQRGLVERMLELIPPDPD